MTQRTSVARAFCDTVRGAGYKAGIYASYYYLLDRMHIGQLEGDNYIWMASYADSTSYPRSHDMWQYTDNGRVPGHHHMGWTGRQRGYECVVRVSDFEQKRRRTLRRPPPPCCCGVRFFQKFPQKNRKSPPEWV